VDENYVYVADTWNHRVQKFTLDGQPMLTFGQSGTPPEGEAGGGLFFGPRDILLLPDGRLLVTDTGNHRLQVFDQDGHFVRQSGSRGALLGQFYEPVGLAKGPDGFIYLADTWNGRIQSFTPDLVPLQQWPVDGWEGDSTENKPYLDVDGAGRVYVSDPEGYRVLVFSSTGEYLGRFGRYGTDANGLGLPNGIAVDAQGNIYLADAGNNRILRYAPLFTEEPEALEESAPGGAESGDQGAAGEAGESIEASPTPGEEQEEAIQPTPAGDEQQPSPTPVE
jgi:sugar lactone lactonase YvrE